MPINEIWIQIFFGMNPQDLLCTYNLLLISGSSIYHEENVLENNIAVSYPAPVGIFDK